MELKRFACEGRYLTGRESCLHALRLSRAGTDSPSESRLRLELLKRGLPMPTVNYSLIVDGRKRMLDLAYPEFRVAMEYNGAHHAEQYADDCERLNVLTAQEWKVFPAWFAMIHDQSAMGRYAANVKRALITAGGASTLTDPQNLWQLSDGRRSR